MEKLIKEINSLGYSVALRQYNKLKVAGEALWDATATHIDSSDMRNHPKHVYMDEITFGRDATHALGKLLDKVKAAAAKKAAKPYDPFEDDAEDAFA